MKQNKINIDWLKDPNFDKKYYTKLVLSDDSYFIIGIWTDEQNIIDGEFGEHIRLELSRYYSPSHAKWINDDVHKEFVFVHDLNSCMHGAPTN